jgi:uncharacterized membrane protein YvbJ
MAYCYECGEKVAENDVFCPYCGISLHPIAVAGADEDDDSLAKQLSLNNRLPYRYRRPHFQRAHLSMKSHRP